MALAAIAIGSGISAIYCFNNFNSMSSVYTMLEKRSSGYEQTAYKIASLGAKASSFWTGFNYLVLCAGAAYSVKTGYPLLKTSNLFMTTLKASCALNFTTLALASLPILYVCIRMYL